MICTWAFLNTIESHAYTLTGMHGVFTTLFFILCRKRPVSTLEKQGTLFVIIGAIIMISDPKAQRVGEEAKTSASLICLLANVPGALFWAANKVLDRRMSMFNLVLSQTLILDIILIGMALFFEGARFDMSNYGLFGFLRPELLFSSFFLNGFLSGFWGICGYVIACKYYSPVVIMNCLLLEPIVG